MWKLISGVLRLWLWHFASTMTLCQRTCQCNWILSFCQSWVKIATPAADIVTSPNFTSLKTEFEKSWILKSWNPECFPADSYQKCRWAWPNGWTGPSYKPPPYAFSFNMISFANIYITARRTTKVAVVAVPKKYSAAVAGVSHCTPAGSDNILTLGGR